MSGRFWRALRILTKKKAKKSSTSIRMIRTISLSGSMEINKKKKKKKVLFLAAQVNMIPTCLLGSHWEKIPRDEADNDLAVMIKEMRNDLLFNSSRYCFHNRNVGTKAAVWPAKRKQLFLKGTAELFFFCLFLFCFSSNDRWTWRKTKLFDCNAVLWCYEVFKYTRKMILMN